MMRKCLSLLVCVCAIVVCLCLLDTVALAADVTANGTCGENLTWVLDSDGVLTISGTGAMTDFTVTNPSWNSYKAQIQRIVIADGVTSIGDRAFYNCTAVTEVDFGATVESIGSYAFRGCEALTSVTIPSSVKDIKASAFRLCSNLTSVTVMGNAPTLGSSAFEGTNEGLTVCHDEGSIGFDVSPWTELNLAYIGELASGKLDGDIIWKLDVLGRLTIRGSGFLNCGNALSSAPWYAYRSSIYTIVIAEGITGIGEYVFYGCSNVTSVTIPNSVKSIVEGAFSSDNGFAGFYTSDGVAYPTGIIAYSLGNYCKTVASNGTAFGTATAVYGYYAKAYFN